MFIIESNTIFWEQKLIQLFEQKKIKFSQQKNKNFFAKITIQILNNQIFIETDKEKAPLKTPLTFNDLFVKVLNILKNITFTYKNISYIPIKQTLIINDKELVLGNIHNIVISNLLLHIDKGIDKNFIYSEIWPNDKEISINKLDTHLTNLKNLIKKELTYELTFTSNKSCLQLLVN